MPRRSSPSKHAPRLLLAIDAAAAAGLALFLDGRLVAHAPAEGATWTGLVRTLQPMMASYQDVPQLERLCCIESGWLGRRGAKGALTLERRRGLAQAAAEAVGFHSFEFVHPSTWHAALLPHRPPDIKAASVALAQSTYNVSVTTNDESDAINIGHFRLHCLT